MKIGIQELTDRVQTGYAIYASAKYFNDLGIHLDKSLNEIFDFVRKIPYQEDGESEIIARPKFLLNKKYFPALDCKKKAVIIGAWLEAHGLPWRLIAISEKSDKKIHHVFPQAKIDGDWLNIDATYPEYFLFQPKKHATFGEELPR